MSIRLQKDDARKTGVDDTDRVKTNGSIWSRMPVLQSPMNRNWSRYIKKVWRLHSSHLSFRSWRNLLSSMWQQLHTEYVW